MANSVDPDQTDPIGAVCFGSTLFASILYWLVMLGNFLQQTTSAASRVRLTSRTDDHKTINPYTCTHSFLFMGSMQAGQTSPKAASYQVLHYLLTECSIKL